MNAQPLTMDRDTVPLQPALYRQLQYHERILKWNPYSRKNLALCYQFQTGGEAETLRLIPDACINFLFKCDDSTPSAVVSGMQTSPTSLILDPNSVYFGFKPYSPKGMCQLSAAWHELVDRHIPLEESVPGSGWIMEALAGKKTFDERIATISAFAAKQLTDADYTPDFVELSELRMCAARGNIRMESISDYTGYTGRYCREKFKESHGISIKNYSSIMRFQNAVRMLSREDSPSLLSDVVFDNGYFDQSHLSRECRRFAGEPPLRFRREVLCC